MARPYWLRLFGPDGPTTLAEFRAALLTAPFGDGVGDGQFLANLRATLNLPAGAERPGSDSPGRGRDFHDRVVIDSAVIAGQTLDAAPGPALDPVAPLAMPDAGDAAQHLAADDSVRTSSLYVNGVVPNHAIAGGPGSPLARLDTTVPYMVIGDLQSGLVIDTRTKTLMQGGPGDYPELLAGPNDIFELDGDYSAGFDLAVPAVAEQLVARGGHDYNLIVDDNSVAAGGMLTVNAMPLRDSNHIIFDGSAESDGRFTFYGSESGDVFLGGGGNDLLYGLGGADVLSGGGGRDTFAYTDAAQSSGADYDVLADFDPTADRIDLDITVNGFDAAVQGGALSAGSFDADLSAALSGLGAGRAVLYAPDAGDLAGNVFLIVDANGVAGYQEGEDYVFALAGATLDDLSGQTGFFI